MANTFSGLWEELKTDALNFWQSVKNEAVTIEHNLVPVIESDLALVLSQFKNLAVTLITTFAQQEFANLTGGQKNIITVNTIIAAAKSAGHDIAVQDAQLLAQQVYNALVSSLPSK
jgi:hypothetical protein